MLAEAIAETERLKQEKLDKQHWISKHVSKVSALWTGLAGGGVPGKTSDEDVEATPTVEATVEATDEPDEPSRERTTSRTSSKSKTNTSPTTTGGVEGGSPPPSRGAAKKKGKDSADVHLSPAEERGFQLLEACWKSNQNLEALKIDTPGDANFHLLSQLTYWYDRRVATGVQEKYASKPMERAADSKMGRWTKKIGREDVIYHAVAVTSAPPDHDSGAPGPPPPKGSSSSNKSSRKKGGQGGRGAGPAPAVETLKQDSTLSMDAKEAYGHLGQKPIFRRPKGIDITRLMTLKKAADISRHCELSELVDDTMEKLKVGGRGRPRSLGGGGGGGCSFSLIHLR